VWAVCGYCMCMYGVIPVILVCMHSVYQAPPRGGLLAFLLSKGMSFPVEPVTCTLVSLLALNGIDSLRVEYEYAYCFSVGKLNIILNFAGK